MLLRIIAALLALCTAVTGAVYPARAAAQNARRGINIANALEGPFEGAWGVTIQEKYFDVIHDAGFVFVRLPVCFSAHAEEAPPYTLEEVFMRRIDEVLAQALARGLEVILDLHHYNELSEAPDAHAERLLGIWAQLAERYRDQDARVHFELCSEPYGNMTSERWNALWPRCLALVRRSNPTRNVIVGGVAWNSIAELERLTLPEDAHLTVTFHYYEPYEFTHQGAEWDEGMDAYLGKTWGTREEQDAVRADFARARAWADAQGVPLLLGEFGAYEKADMDSRVRWTRFVRSEAERLGIDWAYWDFCAGFGIYDPVLGELKPALLGALTGAPGE